MCFYHQIIIIESQPVHFLLPRLDDCPGGLVAQQRDHVGQLLVAHPVGWPRASLQLQHVASLMEAGVLPATLENVGM